MPPPEAPVLSFQAHSSQLKPTTLPIVVPPTASTQGSLAGYCTCALPSNSLDCAPVSPEAMQTVTFWIAASSNICDTAVIQLVGMPSASSVASSSPSDT